ncbi:MAG: hypothetical protein VZT48_00715 [Bulleidia sp.]|nr:hypothetical protein [Bulleidia sp.]
MKKLSNRMKGFLVLILVIALFGVYQLVSTKTAVVSISGYVGGEKIGFLEDEEVQKVLKKNHVSMDYAKAGSIDMVTADHTGKDYLWPSSQTALELYKAEYGKPLKSDAVFQTPIVLYTRKPVAEALEKKGIVSVQDGVYSCDTAKLIQLVEDETSWSSIGLTQLYGNITVGTTDPAKSNSGNMWAGLMADVLAGGIANDSNIDEVLPRLQAIFARSGYMETSSADIFSDFLKMGMGAKPLIVGYESQLLEFSVEQPDIWSQVKDDIVMMYPTPTVWSSHVFIAMDDNAVNAIDVLESDEVQQLAWTRHGFRTGVSGSSDTQAFSVALAPSVTQVVQMPDYKTMEKITKALE